MKNDGHALAYFVTTITRLRQEVTTLTNNIDNHLGYDPDNINWGHAGTAQHVLNMIRKINTALEKNNPNQGEHDHKKYQSKKRGRSSHANH